MKTIRLALLGIWAYPALLHSQGADSPKIDSSSVGPATTARILGDIPDGTPPPPEPPKPKFVVPAHDVLETKTHQQGGRNITIREIAPIALLPKPVVPPVDLSDPAIQARIAEFREENPGHTFLTMGATAYHFQNAPPRSLVRIWQQADGKSVSFWSSADFSLLSGFSSFVDSSGETSSLFLMWSVMEIDSMSTLQEEFSRNPDEPQIPEFPTSKATFIITEGNPTPRTLTSIQSLHDIYNNDHERLKTAYQGRQLAHLQREAELKANPPQAMDITLNYWRIEPSGKGDAQ